MSQRGWRYYYPPLEGDSGVRSLVSCPLTTCIDTFRRNPSSYAGTKKSPKRRTKLWPGISYGKVGFSCKVFKR